MSEIRIPKKFCSTKKGDCHFFGWTGNYQENHCGLYQKYTENDYNEKNPGSCYKKKPAFCKAVSVTVKETK